MHQFVVSIAAALLLAGPATGQPKADGHAAHQAAQQAAAPAATASGVDMADGEIRKIDKGAGRLTLRHGEIRNLDMPGMTMVFQVKDPAMLDPLKVGDKVRFRAEKAAGGYMVTVIEPAK